MATGQTIYANKKAMNIIQQVKSPGQSPSGVIIELAQKAGLPNND